MHQQCAIFSCAVSRAVAAVRQFHKTAGEHVAARETGLKRRKSKLLECLKGKHQRRHHSKQGGRRVELGGHFLQIAHRHRRRRSQRYAVYR